MDNSFDVFISYSRQDYVDDNNKVIPGNPVSAIKDLLSKNGISYWFDEEGIYHGDNFAEKIAANIEKSTILLFLSSVNSNASKWTSKEIAAATEWKKKIIPIRLDESPYNRSVMLYISDLDFVEYYKDPVSAQKTVLDSIRNYKEELERKRILEGQKRKQQAKEKEEREKAEKRKQEQEELSKEIANAIHIVRLSEEALEKQRSKLIQQINTLDSKSERNNLLLQLDQSNQAAFEERAKSRLLSETVDALKKDIEKKANDSQLSKQAEEYESIIDELKKKCANLESANTHGAPKEVQLRIEEEQKKNEDLRKSNYENSKQIDSLSKRQEQLSVICIFLLLCLGAVVALTAYIYIEYSSEISYLNDKYESSVKEVDSLNEEVNRLKSESSECSQTTDVPKVPNSALGGEVLEFEVGSCRFKMIPVEAGTFTMGSTPEQKESADNETTHQVTLTNNYYIGQTEVTQALWKAVMGSNPSYFKGDNRPVECVSWNDCQKFITKLNKLTSQNFRLPTEAEWEYAARGGKNSQGYQYSGSNNLDEVAWYTDNSSRQTHNVATKQPNELGVYDMSGNVWEWCQDWCGSYSSTSQTNPTGATSGYNRVNRGGGWDYDAGNCRSSNRSNNDPGGTNYDLGLRLVLSE